MIRFKKPEEVVAFLDKNLPDKIKEELFFSVTTREYRGKMVHNRLVIKPFFIVDDLRLKGFIIGITDDPKNLFFPQEYLLQWTKLKKFMEHSDTLLVEQEKYGLVSINTACKMLEVTRPTIYKIIKDKNIPIVEILSQKRIQLKDLLDYIEANKKIW